MEKITSAAVLYGAEPYVGTCHAEAWASLVWQKGLAEEDEGIMVALEVAIDHFYGDGVEGFVTSHGRFVDRVDAMKLAKAARQVTETQFEDALLSEDIWEDL